MCQSFCACVSATSFGITHDAPETLEDIELRPTYEDRWHKVMRACQPYSRLLEYALTTMDLTPCEGGGVPIELLCKALDYVEEKKIV